MPQTTTVLLALNAPDDLRSHLGGLSKDIPGVQLLFPGDPGDADEMQRLAETADIIVGWRVAVEVLLAAKGLKQFIFGGVGAQSMLEPLLEVNKQQPVTLLKCVANTYATAQHAVALLLALANRIIPHHTWMKEGHWRRGDDYASSYTLRDRRIGLLGYGDVNQKVHRFLAPFDVEFSVLRRSEPADREWLPPLANHYTLDKLEKFLKETDVLVVGIPLTTASKGLIGAEELQFLGSEGLLINVARGPVIDEQALYEALREKVIGGAAIDVWYNYRPEPDVEGFKHPSAYPFHELDNVVLSPHRAASPVFDLRRWEEVMEHIRRFANDEAPVNVVDLEREY